MYAKKLCTLMIPGPANDPATVKNCDEASKSAHSDCYWLVRRATLLCRGMCLSTKKKVKLNQIAAYKAWESLKKKWCTDEARKQISLDMNV